jgi:hypothetical protein
MQKDTVRVRVTVTLERESGHEMAWSAATVAVHDFTLGELQNFAATEAKRRVAQLWSRIGWPKS